MIIVNLIPEISTKKFVATSNDEFTPLLEKVSSYFKLQLITSTSNFNFKLQLQTSTSNSSYFKLFILQLQTSYFKLSTGHQLFSISTCFQVQMIFSFQFVKKGLVMKCEIHGVKKIENWVAKHGGGKDDRSVLKSDFRYLIRAESKDDYQLKLMNVVTRWSQPFISYFMQHVAPEIEKFSLWTARSWNYPTTEDSIVTSNQCEHINRLAAEQQNWTQNSRKWTNLRKMNKSLTEQSTFIYETVGLNYCEECRNFNAF